MIGYDKPVIGEVEQGYPAAEAGSRRGHHRKGWEIRRSMYSGRSILGNQFHQGEKMKITFIQDVRETATANLDAEDG